MTLIHLPNSPLFYDFEIVELALLTMLKHILFDGDSAAHLISALAACSMEDTAYICSGIIRLWLDCVGMQIKNEFAYGTSSHHWPFFAKNLEDRLTVGTEPIEADKNFYDREKTRLFEKVSNVDAALYKIIYFFTEAAKTSSVIRRALVDVGALSLVIVAFIASDFLPSNLVDIYGSKGTHNGMKSAHTTTNGRCHTPSQIPLDVILTEAKTLSVLMHDATFRKSWSDKRFNMRRHLSSLLVNALLGDFGQGDDGYAWTRALFRKILS
jgi:hypothetical protein